jgi:hypothetical protein
VWKSVKEAVNEISKLSKAGFAKSTHQMNHGDVADGIKARKAGGNETCDTKFNPSLDDYYFVRLDLTKYLFDAQYTVYSQQRCCVV